MNKLFLCLILVATVGCQTSNVITDSDQSLVFVDGVLEGKGRVVEISSMGSPEDIEVIVKNKYGSKTAIVEKNFTTTTLISSLYTFGLGLLLFWELPKVIFVPNKTDLSDPWNPKET